MSDYPHIGDPQRQGDGTYSVKVERGPDDSREMSYPGLQEARAGVQALRMAQDLLVAVPKPTHVGPACTCCDPNWPFCTCGCLEECEVHG